MERCLVFFNHYKLIKQKANYKIDELRSLLLRNELALASESLPWLPAAHGRWPCGNKKKMLNWAPGG